MSGTNFTIIPSLTSTTCNLIGEINNQNSLYYETYHRYLWDYRVERTDPININDFKILAKNIVNAKRIGSYFTVWEIQNGVVIYSDPNFII